MRQQLSRPLLISKWWLVIYITGGIFGKVLPPPSIRNFVWRACHEALPAAGNLAKRKPGIDTECLLCRVEVESIAHVMLTCSFARQVWALSHIPSQALWPMEESVQQWMRRCTRCWQGN
ncbi:UNVERIFIED_CONTAM: hypothetical protein Sradi_0196100 [Sesamum radiatum]|uniref:Reverse transcriptase zinc-binding domain-containing protein n=1 Tax=Sesamum radiatum TaxID=300843 RepID=A0AAW2W3G4_SESRA